MTWIFWTAMYLLAQFIFALFLGNAIQRYRVAAPVRRGSRTAVVTSRT